jgi:hypothetical protein
MKKTGKRIISILLSALMVITMIPSFAFTASADDAVNAVQSAISAYESKMNGTIFKNMAAAYNAYVDAQKKLDSYLYGDTYNTVTAANLNSAASALTTATNNMTAWSAATTNTYAANDSSKVYSDETFQNNNDHWDGTAYYKQAIWIQTGLTSDVYSFTANDSTTKAEVRYPGGVFLYDGINEIKTTIALRGHGGGSGNKNRYLVGANVNTKSGTNCNLVLVNSNWYGSGNTYDVNWMLSSFHDKVLGSTSKTGGTYRVRKTSGFWGANDGDYRFANIIKYNGTLTSSNSGYVTITPNFSVYFNSSDSWATDDGNISPLGVEGSTKLYIINYKKLTDAINAVNTSNLSHISNYKQGGASAYLSAYDALTAINPNSTISGATTSDYGTKAKAIGDAIDSAVSGMNGKTITADNSALDANYAELRNSIKNLSKNFNSEAPYNVNVDPYTVYHSSDYNAEKITNYAEFAEAYEAATSHMASLTTSSYNAATAASLATALSDAFDALDIKGAKEPSISEGPTFIASDATVIITNNDTSGAEVHYSIAYDGEHDPSVTNSFSGSSATVNIFGGTADHGTAVLTAWAVKGTAPSSSVHRTYINEEYEAESLIYRESFDNAQVVGEFFTTGSEKGLDATLANGGTASIEASAGADYDKRTNVLKINASELNTRGNYIQMESNPLSSGVNAAYAKQNGVTVSFWRKHNAANSGRWLGALSFTSYDNNHEENRFKYLTLTSTAAFTFVQRNNNNGSADGGGYMDYFPNDCDITNHSAATYEGYWANIVLTVNPKKNSLNDAVIMYINGEPHDVSSTDVSNIVGRSKSADFYSMSDSEVVDALLEFITDKNTHFDFAYAGYGDVDIDKDLWLDDIRIYTKPLTQVEINNMYTDALNDAKNAGVDYQSSTSHDPTNVAVYTLKEAVATDNGTKAAGSKVGQEFIDYYNVPDSNYDVEYYSFGTGLTVYHSYDNLNWTCVGDSEGRFGYQNQELFVSASGQAQPYYTTLADTLAWAAQDTTSDDRAGAAGKLVWAPHVMYNLSLDKWMYYGSTSSWNSSYSTVFLLESDDIDHGYKYVETIVKSQPGDNTNAIDSCVYYGHNSDGTIDKTQLYCLYGSWSDVRVKTLNANGRKTDGERDLGTVLSIANGGGEGGYMIYKDGYYYYFITCEANGWAQGGGNYHTRVFRSENPTSDFVSVAGTAATTNNDPHGNAFFTAYDNSTVNYKYTSTGHNSVYKTNNNYGEEIYINAAHTREYSHDSKPIEDGALATRQISLIGNVAIQNPVAFTSDGWPVAFPKLYDNSFSLQNRTATSSERNYFTAYDIDGEYAANSLTENGTVSNETTFKVYALNSTVAVIVDESTLNSHLIIVEHTDNATYMHINDDDDTHYGEGVIACQGVNGEAVPMISYLIEKGTGSTGIGHHVWGVKIADNKSIDDVIDDIDSITSANTTISGKAYYEGNEAVNADNSKPYSNVAYTTTTTGWGAQIDKAYMYSRLGLPDTSVLVYDGNTTPSLPVAVSTQVVDTSKKPVIRRVANESSNFELRKNWTGFTGNATKWPGASGAIEENDSFGYTSDSNSSSQERAGVRYWWNQLYYTGTVNTSSYYDTIDSIQFRYYGKYSNTSEDLDFYSKSGSKIYVINYKPVYDILTGTTKLPGTNLSYSDVYNDIKAGKYTTTSTMAYYRAMELIATADPDNYNYSSNTANAVKECADNIKLAVGVFNSINLQRKADLTTFDAAYERADAFMNSLDGTISQYTEASVVALKNALTATNVSKYANADAETRGDYGTAVQTDADTLAANINSAYDGLTLAPVDSTAYEAAVTTITNLDPEAYDETSSITSARSAADEVSTDTVSYGDSTITFVTEKIQDNVDDVTNVIMNALTASVKQYSVDTAETDVSEVSANNGQYYTDTNKATYGTKMTFRSDDPKTAWFLELTTATTHKQLAFAGSGAKFETKVLGNVKVKAVSRTDDLDCRVTIARSYDNDPDKAPIEYLNYFASGSVFELPDAPALAYYTFKGYYIGDNKINSDSVTINEDTEITAKYEVNNDASCAINATDIDNNSVGSNSYEYNERVELAGGSGTYAWIEATDETHFRPFYIGEDVSFFATEPATLKAVSKEEFNAFKFSVPTINLRQSGVITSGTKTIFNAQVVAENIENIRECGIIIGVARGENGIIPDSTQLTLENTGSQTNFRVVRAKSTKFVGANQISIAINNVPSQYSYRAYVIYDKGEDTPTETVYTDVIM